MAMRLSRNMVVCLVGELPHGPCLLHIAQPAISFSSSFMCLHIHVSTTSPRKQTKKAQLVS
jgi:hypothetical protein